MLIGICGSVCAGKSTVAQYLVDHHGFKRLRIAAAQPPKPAPNGAAAGVLDLATPESEVPPAALNGAYKQQQVLLPVHPPRQAAVTCASAEELLEFVTKRWRQRWVTTDIPTEAVLDTFARRPFFLLISVDAPTTVRWRRYQQRQAARRRQHQHQHQHQHQQAQPSSSSGSGSDEQDGAGGGGGGGISLESFLTQSDAHLYDPARGHMPLMSRASVKLLNTSTDLAHLYATLARVDLPNPDRLRPGWDTYFMALASLAARRSNCMKRRVGCVLVRERRVISTGYNGTPRGLRNCDEGGCARCNEGLLTSGVGLATCLCIHAEENALLEAGRERIREGATLYCDTCPCLTCSIKIAQVGISEVVYSQGYSMDGDTAAVFREAGVRLRQFVPPAGGLIHLEKMDMFEQE
ncbi:uncharacterized protein E0L32_000039 [Thyridium curvatum]|uniref:Deoxycytidylate deaminase n=1 Tax=Thyridium curvatum TaxID=1093900 RepID=A0A507AY47_9PEZI|nr:uncharacterized protein E0L32_000039 [Thyridium curvatum]TPX15705.1 hypothetical protein E0L32_000039 [Thyridium curvatum]